MKPIAKLQIFMKRICGLCILFLHIPHILAKYIRFYSFEGFAVTKTGAYL